MCIAILALKGQRLSNLQLWAGWSRNGDGGGFAFVDPEQKKVVIRKGFMKYNEFQKAYDEAFQQYGEHSNFIIHMRIRSAGSRNENNTHPFPVEGGAMIHNGTMFTPTSPEALKDRLDEHSDTRVFANGLADILKYSHVKRAYRELGKVIGSGNKLVFLYDSGEFILVNEESGNWNTEKTIWFSNTYSCTVDKRITDSMPSDDKPVTYDTHTRNPNSV